LLGNRPVTDQGSHFKNTVIADLQHQLEAKHHFTTARCPWANGRGKRHETSFASVSGAAFGMENGTKVLARVGASGAAHLQSDTSGEPQCERQWTGACASDDESSREIASDSIAVWIDSSGSTAPMHPP
jgi:hypothetical protein